MIQLSEFFQYSFVLILKRKCLVGASRVRCGRVVLLQLVSIHDAAVGVTNLDVMLLWKEVPLWHQSDNGCTSIYCAWLPPERNIEEK